MISRRATFVVLLAALLFHHQALGFPVGQVEQDDKRRLYQPENVDRPAWLEARKEAQLETASSLSAFHAFRFEDRVEASGITFRNGVTVDSTKHYKAVHYDHGNGVAVADVDSDGRFDLYFTSQVGENELWRNLGSGRFENVTDDSGVAVPARISVAASFGDIDNDGDPDLFVTTVRNGNLLFENDGKGKFVDISKASGLDYVGHSSGAVFFDYDHDGLLDLYVSNVGSYSTDEVGPDGYFVGVTDAFAGHLKPERTERSLFYRNLGKGRFEEVAERIGLSDDAWTGDAAPVDFNGDGWTDLYVLNMQGHDEYYENDSGKRFVRKSREYFPETSWGAMGVGAFDYDNDGDQDLYITDMHSDMSDKIGPEREKLKSRIQWDEDFLRSEGKSIYGNSFFVNEGSGVFKEASDSLGVETYWPWGLSVGDLNADGFEDIFVTAGMNYLFRYGVNSLFLNEHADGFADAEFILGVEPRRDGRITGPAFTLHASGEDKDLALVAAYDLEGDVEVWGALASRASVVFDLDLDGDLDIVTNEFNDGPMVLVSDLSEKKDIRYLSLELVGVTSNVSAFGARVSVVAGDERYTRWMDGKTGYLAQSQLPLYFGLDGAETIDLIEIAWPSGDVQLVRGPIAANQRLRIVEGRDPAPAP